MFTRILVAVAAAVALVVTALAAPALAARGNTYHDGSGTGTSVVPCSACHNNS